MLTKIQYSTNWQKLLDYKKILFDKYDISDENNRKIISDLYIKKAKSLGLKYKIHKNGGVEIIHPNDLPEYQEMVVSKEVIVPREERQSSCDIAIVSQNFKDQMLGAIDYTNATNREVYYELCETPKGKRMTSPTFGDKRSVTPAYGIGKCSEFGMESENVQNLEWNQNQ